MFPEGASVEPPSVGSILAKGNSEALNFASGSCQVPAEPGSSYFGYASCGKLLLGPRVLRHLEDHCLPAQGPSWRPLRGPPSPITK